MFMQLYNHQTTVRNLQFARPLVSSAWLFAAWRPALGPRRSLVRMDLPSAVASSSMYSSKTAGRVR